MKAEGSHYFRKLARAAPANRARIAEPIKGPPQEPVQIGRTGWKRGFGHESTSDGRYNADDNAVRQGPCDRFQARCTANGVDHRCRRAWRGGRWLDRRGAYARS